MYSFSYDTYQLMKELLPAEWFPMRRIVIFFRGARRDTPRLSAILTSPVTIWRKRSETWCHKTVSLVALTGTVLMRILPTTCHPWQVLNPGHSSTKNIRQVPYQLIISLGHSNIRSTFYISHIMRTQSLCQYSLGFMLFTTHQYLWHAKR